MFCVLKFVLVLCTAKVAFREQSLSIEQRGGGGGGDFVKICAKILGPNVLESENPIPPTEMAA